MYSSLQKMLDFQMDSKDRAKNFECRNSGFARSKSLLNRFDQNLILETEKLHPLKNSDQASAFENEISHPLKSFEQISAFKKGTSHPLKNSDQPSAFVRIKSLLDRFNKNQILKTENYVHLKISSTKLVVRAKFRADVLLSGYT